jgi:hypothetical protein
VPVDLPTAVRLRSNVGTPRARAAGAAPIWEAVAVLELGTVLAHQGGWDEALMFLVPVGLFVLLFRAASARAHHPEAHGDGPTTR